MWGGDGNGEARLLSGSEIGLIGFGDLGRALNRLLQPFRAQARAHDPWLPDSVLREAGMEPASLDEVLTQSDVIFVLAAVTTENGGFLGADSFARMRKGASFILLSRAGVVGAGAETPSVIVLSGLAIRVGAVGVVAGTGVSAGAGLPAAAAVASWPSPASERT